MKNTGRKFTLDEKITELKRELSTRKRVYPDWIKVGRITKQTAEERIGLIEDILEDYRRLKEKNEGTQGGLFYTTP